MDVLATPDSQDVTPTEDTTDLDDDPLTDMYLTVEWSGAGDDWPGVDLPVALYTAAFTPTAGFLEGETTDVNFTASETDPDYTFFGASALVQTCVPGDMNGDGNITPLDASLAFQLYLTKDWDDMTPAEQCAADMNESGSVTPADASLIFQTYLSQ
jgi:hypothetical protein